MSASKIPNKDGKYERKFKLPDGSFIPDGRRPLPIPHDTPVFYRDTTAGVFRLDTMVQELGCRGRQQIVNHGLDLLALLVAKGAELAVYDRKALIEEALGVVVQLEHVASRLNYRDRGDLLADAISSLEFLMKRSPLPAFAKIEDTPLHSPPQKPDQPNLL